jgi:2-haloacid dehalogenase
MNIVFDIGNVLLRWDPRFLYTQYFDDEEQMEWFLAHVCNHEWNLEQDRGRSFAEAVKLATAQFPDHAEAIAAYDTQWQQMIPHAIEGTVEIFNDLVGRDAPVYAITNWNGDKFREAKQRFPFLYEFRDIVVSGDEKLLKPDPAISNPPDVFNPTLIGKRKILVEPRTNVITIQQISLITHLI